jgi:hypothetical protein
VKVVINQSNYLPWKGYFDLIHDADVFIFLDDVQYTKNDWRNRNRIKGPNGPYWLTVPVGGSTTLKINEITLPGGLWREKHHSAITQSYCHAPFYSLLAPFLREVYEKHTWHTLSELNQFLIKIIAHDFLGVTTEFADSSTFGVTGEKQDRVLALLRATGATTYISGPAAKAYIDPVRFDKAGIELVWKDYSGYPEYPQPYPPFEHTVSIVDLLFSVGPAAPYDIWGWRNSAQAPLT